MILYRVKRLYRSTKSKENSIECHTPIENIEESDMLTSSTLIVPFIQVPGDSI